MGNYIIGIGGTGMRCLESFIHLCAAGMMDQEEINLLLLDTDFNNGNKSRTRDLIDTYISLRNVAPNRDEPECANAVPESLFSAKLNLYEFYPHYQGSSSTFTKICDYDGNVPIETRRSNDDLAGLFFDDNTRNFDLEHGYRAQTHIGSYLMFHEIVNHIRRVKSGAEEKKDRGLYSFLEKLTSDQDGKVFILGSIFGGTGASSIPIIPRALQAASIELGAGVALSVIKFGTTLLSNYFSFPSPGDAQEQRDRVVANAQRFALNSQAALMFYEGDRTVQDTYQRLYLLGWPDSAHDYGKEQTGSETLTGGKSQTNSSHVIELMAAFAAHDFFRQAKAGKVEETDHQWFYRSVAQQNGAFQYEFADFAGEDAAGTFKQKLTALFGLALMVQNDFDGSSEALYQSLYRGDAQKLMDEHLGGSGAISPEAFKLLDKYLAAFAYQQKGEYAPGYLMQLQQSSKQADFLFNSDAYASDPKALKKFGWGKIPKSPEEWAKKKKFTLGKGYFDPFSRIFKESEAVRPYAALPTPMDKFINWNYRSMKALFFPSE